MLLITLIILTIFVIYLLRNDISIITLLKSNNKEHFLITVKDRQKIGTSELEDGKQPKSTWKAGNMNYETCYSTETRNGKNTGRHNTYYCNQGIDGGEVIPAEGLYSLDFSNYTTHPGKRMRGKPLTGYYQTSNGGSYTLNNDGTINGQTLTLAQSKSFCDFLKDKCEGFNMVIHTKDSTQNSKTFFIAKKEEGWEDPDTYSKKQQVDNYITNIISYVKKDVNAEEKSINQDKINLVSDKYKNLPTCNWKSSNRCIFKDYKYDQSNATCKSNDGLSYSVDGLKDYSEQTLSNWLKTLYNQDMGVNKLASEAVNVNEYIQRCKDLDGYEFLSRVDAPNPYIPTTKPGDVNGRYVRISINNTDVSQNWLQLAEVQVISNNRNIAISKSTSSSGNYPGSSNTKANDGNNDGNWNNGSVYHSGNGSWNNDGNPQFWEVDLGDASQTIDKIVVTNRTDCCGNRLSNWLLSIYDYNKNLVWARIYREPPNPKVMIDIKASENDMNNIRVKDYTQSRFNKYFYRLSDTEFKSKGAGDCGEQCHIETCAGEGKKWIGNYQCRDYRSGEREAEEAAKKRIQPGGLIPIFDKNSDTAITNEGIYTIKTYRASVYPCYNISTTGGYINGGALGSIFDNDISTGVDFESYSTGPNHGLPYRIVVFFPPGIEKGYEGYLKLDLVTPWKNCLPQSISVHTMNITPDEYNILSNTDIRDWYGSKKQLGSYLWSGFTKFGEWSQVSQNRITYRTHVNFYHYFNAIVFEIQAHWGSEGRAGSNSVWITSISFEDGHSTTRSR